MNVYAYGNPLAQIKAREVCVSGKPDYHASHQPADCNWLISPVMPPREWSMLSTAKHGVCSQTQQSTGCKGLVHGSTMHLLNGFSIC
jgi:hypothetical protein